MVPGWLVTDRSRTVLRAPGYDEREIETLREEEVTR